MPRRLLAAVYCDVNEYIESSLKLRENTEYCLIELLIQSKSEAERSYAIPRDQIPTEIKIYKKNKKSAGNVTIELLWTYVEWLDALFLFFIEFYSSYCWMKM